MIMSYIAKVYLNKMFPKADSIKVEGDNLVFTMNNVINPIVATTVPDDINNYFEIIGDENIAIAGKNKPDVFGKMKIVWGDKTIDAANFKSFKDQVLPTGESVKIYVPNTVGWKTGENHKITVKIFTDRPTVFTVERSVA
jgi:hypothetical protein